MSTINVRELLFLTKKAKLMFYLLKKIVPVILRVKINKVIPCFTDESSFARQLQSSHIGVDDEKREIEIESFEYCTLHLVVNR